MRKNMNQKIIWDNYKGDYQIKKTEKILFSIVKKYISGKILDVGAATGEFAGFLKKKGFKEVKSIDTSPKNDEVEKGSIADIPFTNASFDTIVCTEVLEHLPPEVLNKGVGEVYRVLKSGGVFILTVPFEEDLEKNMCTCPECGNRFHKVGHERAFTVNELKLIMKDKGFRVVFFGVYSLGAMSKIFLGRYLNFIFKRLSYDCISKTIVMVCKKS